MTKGGLCRIPSHAPYQPEGFLQTGLLTASNDDAPQSKAFSRQERFKDVNFKDKSIYCDAEDTRKGCRVTLEPICQTFYNGMAYDFRDCPTVISQEKPNEKYTDGMGSLMDYVHQHEAKRRHQGYFFDMAMVVRYSGTHEIKASPTPVILLEANADTLTCYYLKDRGVRFGSDGRREGVQVNTQGAIEQCMTALTNPNPDCPKEMWPKTEFYTE